ncbi:DUF692 domain-containing protein [Bowmanella yangjiangensis]|uniref:UPF0276 protein J0A65_13560 n=1 Tax=Bowmanella yangjiangensis TaxID=2811230 RepID=A0ABS3CUU5_9ALTE|nr:DUF692 domain-containing protein [Bowmanella yangjiangensis]MBN7820897.1 DUF692 domain-containing protein [Bowmanella yangjiangensis]
MALNATNVGLGLRREMLEEVQSFGCVPVDFWEVAPENWMPLGGRYQKQLSALTQQYEFKTHGLSLSIGSPDALDIGFVKAVKRFLDEYNISTYSEHLSYCSAAGHLYDLMPIPFCQDAVRHVSDRVKQVQDILQRPLALENVSYYAAPDAQMAEIDFILSVLEQADCQLLLDVNNIYVNGVNHGYDAVTFLKAMPTDRIAYLHIAGHYNEADDLIVDTHGADVIQPVWDLLELTYQTHGVLPTLLERDFNIPPLPVLLKEVERIRALQMNYLPRQEQRA